MSNRHYSELIRLVLVAVVFAGTGFLLDEPLLFLSAGLGGYCVWSWVQLRRTFAWLHRKDATDPPESIGLWGEVFDGIYELQQRNREEQRRLQATIDHLRGSFVALSDAVVMVTSAGAIEWCNPAATRLLGLRFPQDKNQQLVNLLRDPRFITYFENGRFDEPLQLVSPVDVRRQLLFQITLFGQGSRLVFGRDVTKIHQIEQMRKDFIANVSHELRTPLTVINGYLETMQAMEDMFPEKLRKALEQMLDQSHRMENLVKDLLLLSRLESVPLEKPVAVPVSGLLESIHKAAQAAGGEQYTIDLQCQPGWAILGNYDELYSAVSNLVFNALRYSDAGSSIGIEFRVDENHGLISVRDTGIGIEPQHLGRITERFYRVDSSRSKDTGGTGLGLAIVKHVLMRHGADLRIESRFGKGSCFTCVFPKARLQQV